MPDEAWLLPWVVIPLAWLWLIRSGFKFGLFSRYRLIYTSVIIQIAASLTVRLGSLWLGTDSYAYSYLYYASLLLFTGLDSAVALSIHRVFGPFRAGRDWHLAAVPALILTLGLTGFDVWLYVRLANSALMILCYLAMTACIRMALRGDIDLGWNLKGTLLNVSVPPALHALLIISYNSGLVSSYEFVAVWNLRVGALGWVIIALAMSEYSPPRGVGRESGSRRLPGRERADGQHRRPFFRTAPRRPQTAPEPPQRASR